MVSGHADILEDIGAQQEAHFVREGIERLARTDQSGGKGGGVEAVDQVDLRARDGGTAKSGAQELDMGLFVNGDVDRVLPDGFGLEGHNAAASDGAGCADAVDVAGGQAYVIDGEQIIFRLKILKVQGKVQNISVSWSSGGGLGATRAEQAKAGRRRERRAKAGIAKQLAAIGRQQRRARLIKI